jgi:hypothetical protein
MRPAFVTAVVLAVFAATSVAAQETTIIHITGHSWEDGAFPPSTLNDEMQAVGIITGVEQPLQWDPASFSYTWYMRQLISLGEVIFGTTRLVNYAGGLITFYVDVLPSNHDYGINPPNATSPSTFTDGISIYLDGEFTEFTLTFNDVSQAGSFTGTINFTGGDVFPLLQDPQGWTLGSNIAGVSPTGYDLQLNGDVFLQGPISVDDMSWGAIKSLYR